MIGLQAGKGIPEAIIRLQTSIHRSIKSFYRRFKLILRLQ